MANKSKKRDAEYDLIELCKKIEEYSEQTINCSICGEGEGEDAHAGDCLVLLADELLGKYDTPQ